MNQKSVRSWKFDSDPSTTLGVTLDTNQHTSIYVLIYEGHPLHYLLHCRR